MEDDGDVCSACVWLHPKSSSVRFFSHADSKATRTYTPGSSCTRLHVRRPALVRAFELLFPRVRSVWFGTLLLCCTLCCRSRGTSFEEGKQAEPPADQRNAGAFGSIGENRGAAGVAAHGAAWGSGADEVR